MRLSYKSWKYESATWSCYSKGSQHGSLPEPSDTYIKSTKLFLFHPVETGFLSKVWSRCWDPQIVRTPLRHLTEHCHCCWFLTPSIVISTNPWWAKFPLHTSFLVITTLYLPTMLLLCKQALLSQGLSPNGNPTLHVDFVLITLQWWFVCWIYW